MDSKSIYINANHMQRKMFWDMRDGNEWFYIGDKLNIQPEQLQVLIDERISGNDVYLALGRRDSVQISKKHVASEIKVRLHNQNILICRLDFLSMIEINYIGVARYGEFRESD